MDDNVIPLRPIKSPDPAESVDLLFANALVAYCDFFIEAVGGGDALLSRACAYQLSPSSRELLKQLIDNLDDVQEVVGRFQKTRTLAANAVIIFTKKERD